MDHPKRIGDRTTLAVMLALQAEGCTVLLPFGENTRYDIVIDADGRFFRIQCKTGRLRNGAVRFKACSSYAHHPNPLEPSRDYGGDVDYFAVYCPETFGVYLIPINEMPSRWVGALRVEPARNGQRLRVRQAADFQIAEIRTSLPERPQDVLRK